MSPDQSPPIWSTLQEVKPSEVIQPIHKQNDYSFTKEVKTRQLYSSTSTLEMGKLKLLETSWTFLSKVTRKVFCSKPETRTLRKETQSQENTSTSPSKLFGQSYAQVIISPATLAKCH